MKRAANDGGRGWDDEAHDLARFRFWSDRARSQTPLDDEVLRQLSENRPPDVGLTSEHADIVDLSAAEQWIKLHSRFTAGAEANFSPWNRCLSVLFELGAKTCVVEKYYVCLDYKSEVVSFYSQLDQAQSLTATRLHFFGLPLRADDGVEPRLHDLSQEQRDSYLGYVVVRSGNMPLVGRTVIAVPEYIDLAAAITETVHFFGQALRVRGVPFMQQDERFAVCSQVAVWAIHYAAYRTGLVSRKVVAEIVSLSGAIEPMKPRVSDGLRIDEVAHLMRAAGLSAKTYETFDLNSVDLPRMHRTCVPGADGIIAGIIPLLGTDFLAELTDPDDDVAQFGVDFLQAATERAIAVGDQESMDAARLAGELLDIILQHMIEPSLRSGRAVYAGTQDHAMVVVGTNSDGGDRIFFVNDDQFGPYLALPSLIGGSRTVLQMQGYDSKAYPAIINALDFPTDRTRTLVERTVPFPDRDSARAVSAIVFARPTRLVLEPTDAEFDCRKLLSEAWAAPDVRQPTPTWAPRVSVMMGIDYKAERRQDLIELGDISGAALYANLHLSEWVVIVEDGRSDERSEWELVYDGSSGSSSPVVQASRFGVWFAATHPQSDLSECGRLTVQALRPVRVPDRIGKA